jgi:hypothetical protein
MMRDLSSKSNRPLAAPFQPRPNDISIVADAARTSAAAAAASCLADFRSHTFPSLPQTADIRREDYYGPTTESNWVLKGRLLVGAYPATQDDKETADIISSILKLGIRKFVCLQQEYRPNVPEELWRSGLALRPYFNDVLHLVKNKASYSSLFATSSIAIVDEKDLSFDHCPIVDCGITDDNKVLDLASKLVDELSRGVVIYLHCWGGHGRTGTIVSVMLHLMYNVSLPLSLP